MRCAVPTSSSVYPTWHMFILNNQYYTTPKEEPLDSLVLLAGLYPGRTVPRPYKHGLLKVIAQVARRYHPIFLPPDSREHQRLVRGRFQASIS